MVMHHLASSLRHIMTAAAFLGATFGGATPVHADAIKTVFVIAMENHNWTQPATDSTAPFQIFNNPNAPFLNSLTNPASPNSAQVSFTTAYHNALATPSGSNPSIHPSEPNYIWMEAGSNLGVLNDNQPFGTGGTNQNTTNHFSSLLTRSGKTWKSYQEDIDTNAAGTVLPPGQWTSPITNRAGTYTTVPNTFNGSRQFDYAAKHNPQIFFSDTNGGNDATPASPAAGKYAPLQQLFTDLNNKTVANYNWITPNQFNDMHTALTGGDKGLTGDAAEIKQGDDFLAQIVPIIMASQAYQDDGAIFLWWDESEGTNRDDFSHTLPFFVISPLAKGNAFSDSLNYTHSSTLRTLQEIFGVGPFLGDAARASDLSDLFQLGVIPSGVPAPSSLSLLSLGLGLLAWARRRRRMWSVAGGSRRMGWRLIAG
jgi:phosphatidylinositol-3-phosphatase